MSDEFFDIVGKDLAKPRVWLCLRIHDSDPDWPPEPCEMIATNDRSLGKTCATPCLDCGAFTFMCECAGNRIFCTGLSPCPRLDK